MEVRAVDFSLFRLPLTLTSMQMEGKEVERYLAPGCKEPRVSNGLTFTQNPSTCNTSYLSVRPPLTTHAKRSSSSNHSSPAPVKSIRAASTNRTSNSDRRNRSTSSMLCRCLASFWSVRLDFELPGPIGTPTKGFLPDAPNSLPPAGLSEKREVETEEGRGEGVAGGRERIA